MKGKRWELPQKFRTIYWQNFALTASIVMLTLALLGASFFALSYAYAADERSDEMAQKASVVARLVASYASSGDVRDMREMAGVAASMTDVDFLVCSTEGSVLLTTDENLVDHVLTVPSDVMETALSGERYSARTTLGGIYESKRFVVGVPIESDIWTVGAVFAVTETGRLTTMWRAFFAMFLMTSVIVLLLSFVASAWVSMRQSRPIREMAAATRAFAEGNFDTRMHDYGAGEIGELASAFNAMADSLQETERQRREFIANISHELKTPVTILKGQLSGMLEGIDVYQDRDKYLLRSLQVTGRMEHLIQEMLSISRMETGAATVKQESLELSALIEKQLDFVKELIEQRGQRLAVQLNPEITVTGDASLLGKAIGNLLSNAILYSPDGAEIRVWCGIRRDKPAFTIENTGVHIQDDALPHLFEAFYRDEDSRNRSTGGSGLGLYLVRMILEKHHASCTIENTEDGVRATVQFS